MTDRARAAANLSARNYFISRAGADKAFALWIGRLIAAQGKTYVLQDEHFGHQDFTGAMHDALRSGARVVALLSQPYLDSENCLKEALTALSGDSFNKQQRLIPLRIAPCAPDGMLRNVAYTDLVTERRQADASGLALAILRALGFERPTLAGIPSPPTDVLIKKVAITPEKFRLKTDHLAPRDALLTEVASAFRSPAPASGMRRAAITNSPYVMQAVAGMGGVGKTILALDYARRHAGDYEGVWWIEAETRQQLMQDLAALGARIEPAVGALAVSDLAKAAGRTLEIIEKGDFPKPWLLVYDNVEKPGDIEQMTPAANAHVLITTRWSEWYGMAGRIDVGLFAREEAVDFLCERAGTADRAAAAALAEQLGYLPLALDHAGSYCRSRKRSFATYLDDVAALIKQAPKTGASFAQYPQSVYATFKVALDRVTAGDETRGVAPVPEAGPVMAIAAYLAPDLIPRPLLGLTNLPSAGVDDALAALAEVSLVTLGETENGSPAFSCHRLVQLVAQDMVRAEGGEKNLIEVALEIVDHRFPIDSWEFNNRSVCDELATHGLAVLEHAKERRIETAAVARLHRKIGNLLEARAQMTAAQAHLELCLTIADAVHGPESPESSYVLHDLGILAQTQGRYSDAEPMFRRSIAIKEKTLSRDDINTSATMGALAGLFQDQGRLAEAEPLLLKSLELTEEVAGEVHQSTAGILRSLASLYQAQGRYGEAEPLLKRAMSIDERTVGIEHPSVAETLRGLAENHKELGRFAEAETFFVRAYENLDATLGSQHPSTSTILHELARLYVECGRYTEAEPLFAQCLSLQEKTHGPKHPNVAAVLNELARAIQGQGRFSEAQELLDRCLAISESVLGPEHPSTAIVLSRISLGLQARGKFVEAQPLVQRALAIQMRIWGPDHPRLGSSLDLAALLALDRGDTAVAHETAQQAFALRKSKLPPDHPAIAQSRWTLARVLIAEAKRAEAEPLLREAIAALEAKVTDQHAGLVGARKTLTDLLAGGKSAAVKPVAALPPPSPLPGPAVPAAPATPDVPPPVLSATMALSPPPQPEESLLARALRAFRRKKS